MKVRCSNTAMCSAVVKYNMGGVTLGDKVFCSQTCMQEWRHQNDIFKFAAQGAPLSSRRQTRGKKWYETDNFNGDG